MPRVSPLGYSIRMVIEAVTDQPFERAMQHFLFDPLGMTRTCFLPAEMMTERFVVGHEARDGVLKVARPWAQLRSIYPAGGMITSVADLLRFAR